MAGRNEYSVKNRYYYLMKTNKFETVQVSDAELRKIVEKKQEAIEAKRQKSLRLQSMNTITQQTPETINAFAMPNQMNALTFQNFMVNYQSFLQFQNFFLYRKNLENMYANMQKLTGTPVAMRNLLLTLFEFFPSELNNIIPSTTKLFFLINYFSA